MARHEAALENVPLTRQELHRLLFQHMGEAAPLHAIGGCQICMQPLESDEDVFTLPGCGHLLHKSCFLESVTASLSCPVCKRSVRLGLLQTVCEKVGGLSPVLNTTLEGKSTLDDDDYDDP